MAHSKNFFGLRRGSTKSLTFQVLRGQQITKDRVTAVANPQSTPQMEQRVKMPIVASSRSVLKSLVDHSFEGVTYGEESLKEFSRLNLAKDALTIKQYVPKGAMDTGLSALIVSKGSLNPQEVSFEGGSAQDGVSANMEHRMTSSFTGETFSLATFIDYMIQQGYQSGDQLTYLLVYQGDKYTFVNSDNETKDAYYHRYLIGRIVLDADSDVTKKWTVDAEKKTLSDGYITIATGNNSLTITPVYEKAVGKIVGGCAILSRLNDTTWQRSPQKIAFSSNAFDDPTFADVLGTYLKAGSTSTKYLNSGIDGVDITGGSAA